jgi:calcium/calmodulin-dependent protein kinase I
MVYQAYKTSDTSTNKQIYACKLIERTEDIKGKYRFENEVELLSTLDSQFVIKLYKAYKTETHYYIITELCNGGGLDQLIRARGRLSDD